MVFIVLGSRIGKRGEGSRSWVNGPHNLLNVAVSRAKRRVYVVGNLADWKSGTYASRIAKDLPVEASTGERAGDDMLALNCIAHVFNCGADSFVPCLLKDRLASGWRINL